MSRSSTAVSRIGARERIGAVLPGEDARVRLGGRRRSTDRADDARKGEERPWQDACSTFRSRSRVRASFTRSSRPARSCGTSSTRTRPRAVHRSTPRSSSPRTTLRRTSTRSGTTCGAATRSARCRSISSAAMRSASISASTRAATTSPRPRSRPPSRRPHRRSARATSCSSAPTTTTARPAHPRSWTASAASPPRRCTGWRTAASRSSASRRSHPTSSTSRTSIRLTGRAASAGSTHYENLNNLKDVVNQRFLFVGLPLRLEPAYGSPIRAAAIIEG